jgi:hypothetical protein
MDETWLYVTVFILSYLWGSYGLPYTENQLKSLLYPILFALAVCLAVMGIMHYAVVLFEHKAN